MCLAEQLAKLAEHTCISTETTPTARCLRTFRIPAGIVPFRLGKLRLLVRFLGWARHVTDCYHINGLSLFKDHSFRVGLAVPFTKQESQTLVPSFRVKSTRRVGSISAPHFPHFSSWSGILGLCSVFWVDIFLSQMSATCDNQPPSDELPAVALAIHAQNYMEHPTVYS